MLKINLLVGSIRYTTPTADTYSELYDIFPFTEEKEKFFLRLLCI